jgi:hypothetical protein
MPNAKKTQTAITGIILIFLAIICYIFYPEFTGSYIAFLLMGIIYLIIAKEC